MKRNALYLFAVGMLLWSSCHLSDTEQPPDQTSLPTIPVEPAMDTLPFSAIMDSVEYLPLETTPEQLVGTVNGLWVTSDRIWVMDGQQARVAVFDRSGKALFTFGGPGKGPGELLKLNSMAVVPALSRVYLTDPGKRIQVFDWQGQWQQEIVSPFFFKTFTAVTPERFALYTMIDNSGALAEPADLAYNLLLVDTTFQRLQGQYLPYTQGFDNIITYNRLSRGPTRTLVTYSLYDTIYQVTAQGVEPAYALDFGDHRFDPAQLKQFSPSDIETLRVHNELIAQGVHFAVDRLFHDEEFLCFYTSIQGRTRIVLHHVPTETTHCANILHNDFQGPSSIQLVGLFDHRLYFVVYPYQLHGVDGESTDVATRDLRARIGPDDNPILMIGHLSH